MKERVFVLLNFGSRKPIRKVGLKVSFAWKAEGLQEATGK